MQWDNKENLCVSSIELEAIIKAIKPSALSLKNWVRLTFIHLWKASPACIFIYNAALTLYIYS
mgnify:CR=1 FL=1